MYCVYMYIAFQTFFTYNLHHTIQTKDIFIFITHKKEKQKNKNKKKSRGYFSAIFIVLVLLQLLLQVYVFNDLVGENNIQYTYK